MKTPTLSLSLTPSKWLACYLIVLHLLILLALFYLPLSVLALVLVALAVVANGCYCLWRYCYSGHTRWVDSFAYSHQTWLLHRGKCTERAALKSATVWRFMVVLNFLGEQGACSLVLLPDNCCPQQLRRLRVMLKHRPVYQGSIQ